MSEVTQALHTYCKSLEEDESSQDFTFTKTNKIPSKIVNKRPSLGGTPSFLRRDLEDVKHKEAPEEDPRGWVGWSRGQVDVLLQEYLKHPCLYDTTLPAHKNKSLRWSALDKIRKVLEAVRPNVTIDDVRKKIDNLKTRYNKEKKKVEECLRTTGQAYIPTLFYYKTLQLMEDRDFRHSLSDFDLSAYKLECNGLEETVISEEPSEVAVECIISDPRTDSASSKEEDFILQGETPRSMRSKVLVQERMNLDLQPSASELPRQTDKKNDLTSDRPKELGSAHSLKRQRTYEDVLCGDSALEGLRIASGVYQEIKKSREESEHDLAGLSCKFFAELIRRLPEAQQRSVTYKIHKLLMEECGHYRPPTPT